MNKEDLETGQEIANIPQYIDPVKWHRQDLKMRWAEMNMGTQW